MDTNEANAVVTLISWYHRIVLERYKDHIDPQVFTELALDLDTITNEIHFEMATNMVIQHIMNNPVDPKK